MTTVLFACVQNAGRSQMAAAFFNELAQRDKARAVSAGTRPAERVHPVVVQAMQEVGIDLFRSRPRFLTAALASEVELLVTLGCDVECPALPGVRREDWSFPDPKGRPLEEVRQIRDEIHARVRAFVESSGWAKSSRARTRA